MNSNDMDFEIVKPIAVIGRTENGVTKEVNIIKWGNASEPKIDIRSWSVDHSRPYKGISLSADEAKALKAALDGLESAD